MTLIWTIGYVLLYFQWYLGISGASTYCLAKNSIWLNLILLTVKWLCYTLSVYLQRNSQKFLLDSITVFKKMMDALFIDKVETFSKKGSKNF